VSRLMTKASADNHTRRVFTGACERLGLPGPGAQAGEMGAAAMRILGLSLNEAGNVETRPGFCCYNF